MRHLRSAGLAVVALALSASTAAAQGLGDWEFGTDLAWFSIIKMDGVTGSTTNIALNPGAVVRAGKALSDKLMIEPNVSFSRSADDNSSGQTTALGVAAVWMLMAMEEGKPGWYVRPEVSMSMSKFESGGSTVFDETRTHFGAGVGMKRDAMGILWRVEAFIRMTPEKDTSPSENEFGVKVGGGFLKKKK